MDALNTGTSPEARTDQLVERLLDSTIGALELFSVYLGAELGLYRVLEQRGPLTSAQLGEQAGIATRYAREWLEQQAVAGFLQVEPGLPEAADRERRYRLDPAYARVLTHVDDPAHVAPLAHMLAGIGGVLTEVAHVYRTGDGIPYQDYGHAFRHGQGHINRPAFTHDLPTGWLAAMPDVVARLEAAPHPHIADVGCGQGWSTLAMAHAFPSAWVDGLDLDAASIADARRQAADRHLEDGDLEGRVRFVHADAQRLPDTGPYDLVLILEALHDLPQPVQVLRAVHTALTPGGTVLVVDERVADRFSAPGDKVERMMYGWSVTHCLPAQLAEKPSAATGTVLRAETVGEWAREAGFARCIVLPVDNDFFRLYRLDT